MDRKKPTLAVVVSGGVVQAIVSDEPQMLQDVRIVLVDYDVEDEDCGSIKEILQPDGSVVRALYGDMPIEKAAISLPPS